MDSSPIERIHLPGLRVDLKGLIVLVGANSSGKTSLLRDIHAVASGNPRTLLVANLVDFRPVPELDDYLTFFTGSGDIERIGQAGQNEQYRISVPQYGTQQGAGNQFSKQDLEVSYAEFRNHTTAAYNKNFPQSNFLLRLGMLECSALFIEQRLALTLASPSFDTHQTPATTTLQALRRNIRAQESLTEEMLSVFKRGVWLDLSGGANIVIRVSDNDYVPSFRDRNDPQEMKQYRTIETEGEGIRSYAAVCFTLLLARRPICLIDEPEMCLHPPQARALGRFIGKYGTTSTGCTMVATHNSAVLRGVLESNPQASVIRLTRSGNGFRGRHVSSETLRKATNPTIFAI